MTKSFIVKLHQQRESFKVNSKLRKEFWSWLGLKRSKPNVSENTYYQIQEYKTRFILIHYQSLSNQLFTETQ